MTAAAVLKAAGPDYVGELRRIPLEQLVKSPWNPRKHFDPAKLAETAASLKANGQLTPITVRPFKTPDRYEIGAGHRRYRAAKQLGLASLLATRELKTWGLDAREIGARVAPKPAPEKQAPAKKASR